MDETLVMHKDGCYFLSEGDNGNGGSDGDGGKITTWDLQPCCPPTQKQKMMQAGQQ